MICSNYRPITLLNVAYKIFTILINNRLSSREQIGRLSNGIPPNQSTIDNIFIVRHSIEKCHEFNIKLHNVFIDYTSAFDSVYRDKIIKCLNNYDIPSKLIKLVAKTLQDTKVKVNQNYTEKFEILTEVKQGNLLSATLFSSHWCYFKAAGTVRYHINTFKKNIQHMPMIYLSQPKPNNDRYLWKTEKYFITIWPNSKLK